MKNPGFLFAYGASGSPGGRLQHGWVGLGDHAGDAGSVGSGAKNQRWLRAVHGRGAAIEWVVVQSVSRVQLFQERRGLTAAALLPCRWGYTALRNGDRCLEIEFLEVALSQRSEVTLRRNAFGVFDDLLKPVAGILKRGAEVGGTWVLRPFQTARRAKQELWRHVLEFLAGRGARKVPEDWRPFSWLAGSDVGHKREEAQPARNCSRLERVLADSDWATSRSICRDDSRFLVRHRTGLLSSAKTKRQEKENVLCSALSPLTSIFLVSFSAYED